MIEHDLRGRGIRDEAVLQALGSVPREAFVPDHLREFAYDDGPLPIGSGQTISQPYIVAVMTEWAAVGPRDRVLEIGTGCGYQTAVLARLAERVCTVERIPELAETAAKTFRRLGLSNIETGVRDGYDGWPEAAPFDAIIVTAAAPRAPAPLVGQLAPGGRLVIPVGRPNGAQTLIRYVLQPDGVLAETDTMPVRFVPFLRGTA